MKIIVTHISPDIDALASCWLLRKYLPNWSDARIEYVPAGSTFENKPVDSDENVIHVDTGNGRFDHHNTSANTCATKLAFEFLVKNNVPLHQQSALERMVNVINAYDHFAQASYPDPTNDRYDFSLDQIIDSLKNQVRDINDFEKIVFSLFDSVFQTLLNKVVAEIELKKGFSWNSKWGKTMAIETKCNDTLNLALKMQYSLVIKKEPTRGHVRIKTVPDPKLDLTPLYDAIVAIDKKGTWYLHPSKNILLNGTANNPNFTPSPLSIKQLIEIVKKI